MRLYELLTEEPPVVKYHDAKPAERPHLPSNPLRAGSTRYQGGGVFADVYGHDDNPHEVVKISRPAHSTNIDGYEAFIRELSRDPEMYNNPHFPRIQLIRNVHDKGTGDRQYIVRMERLYSHSALSKEEYDIMVEHTFKPWYIKSVERDLPDWKKNNVGKEVFFNWMEYGFTSMSYIPEAAYTKLKSKELQSALSKIAKLADQYYVRIDIHSGNIMFRRTQYGPVLVITDPLSGAQY